MIARARGFGDASVPGNPVPVAAPSGLSSILTPIYGAYNKLPQPAQNAIYNYLMLPAQLASKIGVPIPEGFGAIPIVFGSAALMIGLTGFGLFKLFSGGRR